MGLLAKPAAWCTHAGVLLFPGTRRFLPLCDGAWKPAAAVWAQQGKVGIG